MAIRNILKEGDETLLKVSRRVEERRYLPMENTCIVIEGLHAINPLIFSGLPRESTLKLFISVSTNINDGEHRILSGRKLRFIRRMVRDNNFRGTSAEDTILRWQSVRRGEYKNIFPYQENADVMFNSSLIYELPLLKHYAEPLLRRISPCSAAYPESLRLLKFLSYITVMNPKEQTGIPPTSVMREFIGESTFTY